jgi:anti-sigma factor RsiW
MSLPDRRAEPSSEGLAPPGTGTPPLTCRDLIGLLLDYLEEALDPDTIAAFEHHLQDCAPCRAYLKTYDRSRRLVGEVSGVEMPEELKDRLRELLLGRLGPGRS